MMLSITEILKLDDPLLLPWLDLYETAFPAGERILVSQILAVLHGHTRRGSHLLAALDCAGEQDARLQGIVFDYEPIGEEAAFLWYIAVAAQTRGQGVGAWLYQSLLARLGPQVKALIFDLEDPCQMETPEEKALAVRRIGFYRRQGARLLGGIRYVQSVGSHQPPLYLRLMIHPLQPISPREGFDLAYRVMPEALSQAGELCWE